MGSPVGAVSPTLTAPAGQGASCAPTRAGSPAELPALGVAVMSPWGWRVLAVFAMVALGLSLTFFVDKRPTFGALWVVVTLAWGGFGLKLWRDHLAWDQTASGPKPERPEASHAARLRERSRP